MRKCKNCNKQKSARKHRNSHTPDYQVTEYGLAKIVSTPKIIVINDEYMLEVLIKNQKKTKKLDKQVSKIKSQIRNLQRSIEKSDLERRNERNSHHYHTSIEEQVLIGSKKAKSRTSSVNSSKNREIGRFTRVSEGESQSFSKNSLKQSIPRSIANETFKKIHQEDLYSSKNSQREERSDSVSFSEQANNNYMLKFPKNSHKNQIIQKPKDKKREPIFQQRSNGLNQRDNNDVLLKYSTKPHQQQFNDHSNSLSFSNNQRSGQQINPKPVKKQENNSIEKYIPSYQQAESSFSSNLLSEDSQNESRRVRLHREFQELIIRQKKAPQEEKNIIRGEIKTLSKVIKTKKA